ncbi:hypothetical protein LCUFL03_230020 [Latilactobacillus curvatus]|nr:hypothetical protein LCUFL03_230020 [Latilactobacillus curvatus]
MTLLVAFIIHYELVMWNYLFFYPISILHYILNITKHLSLINC